MKNTLVFGNGLNRLSDSSISWDTILDNLKGSNKFPNNEFPYTLIYERALFGNFSNYSDSLQDFEYSFKNSLAKSMFGIIPSELYNKIAALKLENYITTNYDYCLNKVFENFFSATQLIKGTEDIYSVRRKTEIIDSVSQNVISNIWNIHGEINKPATIMLGYDHYVGALGKIESYIKGNYEFSNKGERIHPQQMRRKLENPRYFDDYSWIDLFFNSNVHIIGLKLDYSEIDLYWVLNKRARFYMELGQRLKTRNTITFYTNEDEKHKHELLRSFNVDVVYKKLDYKEIYEYALNQL